MNRLAEILALLANPADIGDDELLALETELLTLFDEIRAQDEITPEDTAALREAADAIDVIRGVAEERITTAETEAAEAEAAAAAQAAELEELVNRVHAQADGDDEGDAGDGEGDAGDGLGADEGAEGDGEGEGDDAPTDADRVPVGAGAAAAAVQPRPVGDVRPPNRFAPQPRRRSSGIRQAGTGQELADRVAVDDALLQSHEDAMGSDFAGGKHRVATFHAEFPSDMILPEGRVTDVTDRALEVRSIASRAGGESLTADGGLCALMEPYYQLATIAQAGRPLRASVTQINAKRGGITFQSPIKLADILVDGGSGSATAAIGSMTDVEDLAGNTNKTYQMMACGTDTTVKVDAIWRQMQFGVLQSRTNPERVSQFTDLTLAKFARYTEQRLWTKLLALSTPNDAPQSLGALRDFLTGINRECINFRAINRMAKDATLEIRLPAWVGLGLLPDDQVRALQAYPESFSFGVSQLESLLAERNIRVAAWYEDDFTTAVAAGGGVNAYPSTFDCIITHPGGFIIVDNGTFDIGTFRDGTMVNDNVFRTFAEEFWDVGFWGVDARATRFSLCANGASAGSIAPKCGS